MKDGSGYATTCENGEKVAFFVALSCVNDIMLRELRNKLEMQLIL